MLFDTFLSYVYFDTFCIYNRDKHAELRKRGHSMLGGRLKSLRGKRTQEEVAKQIGVSRARYSHYENGRSEPDYETLKKLADYYKVTIDYLLTGTEKKKRLKTKSQIRICKLHTETCRNFPRKQTAGHRVHSILKRKREKTKARR